MYFANLANIILENNLLQSTENSVAFQSQSSLSFDNVITV